MLAAVRYLLTAIVISGLFCKIDLRRHHTPRAIPPNPDLEHAFGPIDKTAENHVAVCVYLLAL